MNQSINTDSRNSKEPQQKYRLGTVSIKILGGLQVSLVQSIGKKRNAATGFFIFQKRIKIQKRETELRENVVFCLFFSIF